MRAIALTLTLVAMLSLAACASTPLTSVTSASLCDKPQNRLVPDSDLPWELYARQRDEQQQKVVVPERSGLITPQVAEPNSLWDIFVSGMSRAFKVEEARRISSPSVICTTYNGVTQCVPY